MHSSIQVVLLLALTVSASPLPATTTSTPPAPVCNSISSTFGHKADLAQAMKQFCMDAEKQGTQDANAGGISRTTTAQSSKDTFTFGIDWAPGSTWKPNSADCMNQLSLIVAKCDGNAGADTAYKAYTFGGHIVHGPATYTVTPKSDMGYAPGTCSVRLTEKRAALKTNAPGFDQTYSWWYRDIRVVDAAGKTLTKTMTDDLKVTYEKPYVLDGVLPSELRVRPWAMPNAGGVQFEYDGNAWDVADNEQVAAGHCLATPWSKDTTPLRDIDCSFTC